MATYWLDVVRYADSGGYHSDNDRSVWPFRDYVIRAFNANYPFDRFTIEQLAGDLLPDATTEQKVASGYNRLLQTTEEGGASRKSTQPSTWPTACATRPAPGSASPWAAANATTTSSTRSRPRTSTASGPSSPTSRKKRSAGRIRLRFPRLNKLSSSRTWRNSWRHIRDELAQTTPALDEARAKWEQSLGERLKDDEAKKQLEKELTAEAVKALAAPADQRTAEQKAALDGSFRSQTPELAGVRENIKRVEQQIAEIRNGVPQTLISVSIAPRTVRILPRGNWQDDSGEIVGPAVPASLPPAPIADRQKARLDLARWMVAPDNPLVSRVFVNRLWKLFFGEGIVRTLGDFGTQGQWPTHPQLLDWLAVELRDGAWDVKRLIKLIVMSRTYQQTSMASHELRQHDPNNRLLARQTPFRLDAEFVRDNALAISGLLSAKIGGPSVKPYQPAGYWRVSQLSAARMAAGSGRAALSPGAVYALAAHLSASQPGGFRRAQPRRMHGRALPIQYAAAGPRSAERPHLCRGGARTGRPCHSEGGRLSTGPIALRFSARRKPHSHRIGDLGAHPTLRKTSRTIRAGEGRSRSSSWQ